MRIRDYEVSIWTLQDEFLTVLKPSHLECKGQIMDPVATIKDDGTEEFKFSIPMYLYEGTERKENPIWYNTQNGNLIKDLRKIKLTFNKNTNVAKTLEFIILEIEERHENDQLFCDVSCEGLAFHELGKRGFKISMCTEDFENYYKEWFENNHDPNAEPPIANIQYWMDNFVMKPRPVVVPFEDMGIIDMTDHGIDQGHIVDDEIYDSSTWYYEVEMDWKNHNPARDSHKIYEDAFVSSWSDEGGTYMPSEIQDEREKARMVDLEDSNIYNLTQDIAKLFGVFCRYEYIHDQNLYIVGRRVIFYNNYIKENEGYLDITYPYTTDAVTRKSDSKDVTTKMYVKSVEDENSASRYITIMDVGANKTKEDYILNFDYLHLIGNINDDQYAAISEFEYDVRKINDQIDEIYGTLVSLYNRQPEVDGQVTFYTNAIQQDLERLNESNDLLNNLTNNTGEIVITEKNPKYGIRISCDEGSYVKLTEVGIKPETIKAYDSFSYVIGELNNELNFYVETDEYGFATKLIFPPVETVNVQIGSGKVMMTYAYEPQLKYQRVTDTWTDRLQQDQDALDEKKAEARQIDADIATYEEQYNNLLEQKKILLQGFERLMGPALRESYWQPEEFNDYGDNYIDHFAAATDGQSGLSTLIWDNELFDDEQKSYYEVGVNKVKNYYPYFELTSDVFNNSIFKTNYDKLSFIFYDTEKQNPEFSDAKIFTIGSTAQYAYKEDGTPIVILTGVSSLSDISIKHMIENEGSFGYITYNNMIPKEWLLESVLDNINFAGQYSLQNDAYIFNVPYDLYYPRIKIASLGLKTSADTLQLKYNSKLLANYADYYVLDRQDSDTSFSYYITIKPETLIGYGNGHISTTYQLEVKFNISNANISIYLDALKVMEENSQPKVSYTVKPSTINDELLYTLYNKLNSICNINDIDLKFKNVQGYISSLELDCDNPWNDTIEIKNYKTKFEDLFSTIVAQTESMKKNEYNLSMVASTFSVDGAIAPNILQDSITKADLNYSFNNGKLTIDENDGIWGISEDGVVAFRGGGIFTATARDENDNWLWNTGITPAGINANLITTGQLDTNLIRIYAGDNLRLQMNGDGLYAYKSVIQEYENDDLTYVAKQKLSNYSHNQDGLDDGQYVHFGENGLSLWGKQGVYVLNNEQTDFVELQQDVERVKISWDGLTLKNWNNERVFYADADTGNLHLTGAVEANEFRTYMTNGSGYIKINNEEGIKIVNNDQTQSFIATYNSISLTGRVIADSGQFGPWLINENKSIIYDPEETGNNHFGNKNIIYFGENGLSFSDVLKIQTGQATDQLNNQHYIMQQFYIGNPLDTETDTEDTNYVMRIKNINTINSAHTYPPLYMLEFGENFSFGKNFILPRENGGTGLTTGAYYRYTVGPDGGEQGAQWETEIENYCNSIVDPVPGDLIIFSSNQYIEQQSSETQIQPINVDTNIGAQHGQVTYLEAGTWQQMASDISSVIYQFKNYHNFDASISRWNVNNWNNDNAYPPGWGRVGTGRYPQDRCALFIKFECPPEADGYNDKIKVIFSFRTCFENNLPDSQMGTTKWNMTSYNRETLVDQRIFLDLYEYESAYDTINDISIWRTASSSQQGTAPLATGIYNMSGHEGDRPRTVTSVNPLYYTSEAYLDMLPGKQLEGNKNYVIIFYNYNTDSLVYVQQGTTNISQSQYNPQIVLGHGAAPTTTFTPRIYIYSDFQWQQFGV